jgi:hypothetical protein
MSPETEPQPAAPNPAPDGYLHPAYAASLAAWGTPRRLEAAGAWALERGIAGDGSVDAMGCYPLFMCRTWAGLPGDCAGRPWVSLTLVSDPLAPPPAQLIDGWFDLARPFKTHFLVDFGKPRRLSRHHAYYARRAMRDCRVEVLADPSAILEAWTGLYAGLAQRHGIRGLRAFSRAAFEIQLGVPGMTAFVARSGQEVVGAHLWYEHGGNAHSHLAAFSERGYQLMASYALYQCALEHFAPRMAMLDLGAGAGLDGTGDDGLTRFKRGWANASRPAYLCGKILDAARYKALCAPGREGASSYFPAYRSGEFA